MGWARQGPRPSVRARRPRERAAVALALPATLLAGLALAPGAAATTTQPFSYTGSAQTFTVPAGVTQVTIDAFGAQGGSGEFNSLGGLGGEAQATIAVTPGEVLQVNVGGQGETGPNGGNQVAGGFNGGGSSGFSNELNGQNGGGGGGASDVRQGGTTLADRVVVAAGGGGGGNAISDSEPCNGGDGGGSTGGTGACGGAEGGGGTQAAGGAGAGNGQSGTLGSGGDGGDESGFLNPFSGGGGGGGYYGGGGGAGGDSGATAGAGGGGSSYTPDGTGLTAGVRSGNGYVTITYPDVTPSLSTVAADGVVGTAITDTATIAGADNPTGTITFSAYGPGDSDCSQGPAFTDTVSVDSGNGDYVSGDFTPAQTGTYRWTASYSGDANNVSVSTQCNDPGETSTVGPATPAIATTASSGGTVGAATIHDTATISDGVSPTGSVTFYLYGPDDPDCSGEPAFTAGTEAAGNGDYVSGDFTPSRAGDYQWVAAYGGDDNNEAVSTSCGDPNESVTIAKASPTMSTSASDGVPAGNAIGDSAALAGGASPSGTITFAAYGPDDTDCSGDPAFTSSAVTVSGNGTYDSPTFNPTRAGVYRWTATYSGDQDNDPFATSCNDANESVTVARASPSISTTASDAGIGGSIHDTATLAGGQSPGGTVTFNAYGPGDPDCSGAPAFTSTVNVDSGNGSYPSDSFTPDQVGDYNWTADYSGDANNQPASTSCGDSGETSTIAKASPGLSTVASSAAIGQSIEDSATLTGAHDATGTITFAAYGPGDANCSGAPAFTATVNVTAGNGEYGSGTFVPDTAGTYRWTASYSGDASNAGVATACGDPGETSAVAKASPGLGTNASNASIGESIADTATLAGGFEPTGTITFAAYGPGDATCSDAPAFTSTIDVDAGNGEYGSGSFTPSQPGAYNWTATYSGDANNESSGSACGAAGETSTVASAQPTLTTTAASGRLGGSIADTATIAGGVAPTGTIAFSAYGPKNPGCSGPPAFTATVNVSSGNGTYSSGAFRPSAVGAYRWTATYSGDSANESASSACGATRETSSVMRAAPTLTTTASAGITLGGRISDTAKLAAGYAPTGSIAFRVYGPGDSSCSKPPAFRASRSVDGNRTYRSPSFVPTKVGVYRWTASYTGDASNRAAVEPCNSPGEAVAVKRP